MFRLRFHFCHSITLIPRNALAAFGGSKPTADFFRRSAVQSTQFDGGDQDEQSKWQSLDETEKKRLAAKAYEAFEKVSLFVIILFSRLRQV
jgi:hypothetical protein